jgi:hypothetical protein
MIRLIFLSGIIASMLAIASCKKESPCTDLSAYYTNKYIMRDSVIYQRDSVVIVADTITFLPVNSGEEYFINYLMPDKIFLVAKGCANNFMLDTASYGNGFTYTGMGQIDNNGQSIFLQVHRTSYLNTDSVRYYCYGTKQ